MNVTSTIPETQPDKFLRFDGKSWDITIESSPRVTHQLTSNIFKIILQEVLGYPRVIILTREDNFNTEDVLKRLSTTVLEQMYVGHKRLSLARLKDLL